MVKLLQANPVQRLQQHQALPAQTNPAPTVFTLSVRTLMHERRQQQKALEGFGFRAGRIAQYEASTRRKASQSTRLRRMHLLNEIAQIILKLTHVVDVSFGP